jgi:predicted DNA-binding transcriptional regulator YafY
MPRADRLLELLDILRRHRGPVTGARLAQELGVSLRSLYRDIEALRGRGAEIDGEAGFGYVLKPGFLLPPLMLSRAEVEALVLGSRWVVKRGDAELAAAAAKALAKIKAVLPAELRAEADGAALIVGYSETPGERVDLGRVREAIRRERKLAIEYEDKAGRASRRTVWPFALAYFDRVQVLAAWCELRQDFRHFRIDRIAALAVDEARYPRRRAALLSDWREGEGVPAQ